MIEGRKVPWDSVQPTWEPEAIESLDIQQLLHSDWRKRGEGGREAFLSGLLFFVVLFCLFCLFVSYQAGLELSVPPQLGK